MLGLPRTLASYASYYTKKRSQKPSPASEDYRPGGVQGCDRPRTLELTWSPVAPGPVWGDPRGRLGKAPGNHDLEDLLGSPRKAWEVLFS